MVSIGFEPSGQVAQPSHSDPLASACYFFFLTPVSKNPLSDSNHRFRQSFSFGFPFGNAVLPIFVFKCTITRLFSLASFYWLIPWLTIYHILNKLDRSNPKLYIGQKILFFNSSSSFSATVNQFNLKILVLYYDSHFFFPWFKS